MTETPKPLVLPDGFLYHEEFLDQMWGTYEPQFNLISRQHDAGPKTFLGRTSQDVAGSMSRSRKR